MSTWQDLKNNPRLLNTYNARLKIIKLIREFFWSEGFLEIDTPIAVKYAGQEPYLNPMPVTIHDSRNTTHNFYLRTSPEFALKKLLVVGYNKIFELGKCFRNNESFGGLHNPEFTMLEWYRSPGTLADIMKDTERLFRYVAKKLDIKIIRLKDCKIKVSQKWEKVAMKELWKKYVGVNLDNNLTIEQLNNTVRTLGYQTAKNDRYEDLFFKIFLNKIEPNLRLVKPIFVYNYPAQMCSLSKLCKADNRYAERFELYIGGVEIANAFGELTDAKEQKKRLEEDQKLRTELGKPTWPVDPGFIKALESGIPVKAGALPRQSSQGASAGGIALGVDRMVLLFSGAKDINEVIFQSVKDQVDNN